MLDLRAIREDPELYRAGLSRRGVAADLDRLMALDEKERALKVEVEELRAEQNRASKEIGKAPEDERRRLIDSVKGLSDRLKELEPKLEGVQEEVKGLLARLPNVPHESVPDGDGDEDNRVEREEGSPPRFDFRARDHLELGEMLGAIDTE